VRPSSVLAHGRSEREANPTTALGLPGDGLIPRVLAFNVGVQLGQLLAVVAMFMIGDVLRRYITWSKAPRFTNVGLVAAGLVTASVLVVGAVLGGDSGAPAPPSALGGCQVRDRTETYQGYGGHPKKDFFEPGESAPAADFGHVLGDGYVIVHYQPTLPADQLTQLREFVTGPEGNRVVGGADPKQTESLKAVNAYQTARGPSGAVDLAAGAGGDRCRASGDRRASRGHLSIGCQGAATCCRARSNASTPTSLRVGLRAPSPVVDRLRMRRRKPDGEDWIAPAVGTRTHRKSRAYRRRPRRRPLCGASASRVGRTRSA
jgi:hypothetical protein